MAMEKLPVKLAQFGSDKYASIENAVYHPIYLKSKHLIKGTCYFPFSLTCYFSWKMPRERQCVLLRFKALILLSIWSVTKCAYVDPLHWFIEAQINTAAYQQRPAYIIFHVCHAPNTQNYIFQITCEGSIKNTSGNRKPFGTICFYYDSGYVEIICIFVFGRENVYNLQWRSLVSFNNLIACVMPRIFPFVFLLPFVGV